MLINGDTGVPINTSREKLEKDESLPLASSLPMELSYSKINQVLFC